MPRIAFFIWLLTPLTCFADGYPEIYGETKSGLTVVIFEEGRPGTDIAVWRGNDQLAFYRDEPCTQTNNSKIQLTCSAKGKSPMAGATYLGRSVKGTSCHEPEYVYSCVAGCGKGSEAPRILRRGHWEC